MFTDPPITDPAARAAGFCDRLEASRAFFGSRHVGLEIEALDSERFHAHSKLNQLDEIALGTVNIAAARFERTRERIAADGKDDFALAIVTKGWSITAQCGREVEVRPGEAILTTDAEWAEVRFPHDTQFLILQPSRGALSALVAAPDRLLGHRISAGHGPLQLLTSYAATLQGGATLLDKKFRHVAASHLLDLVAHTLQAGHTAVHSDAMPAVRAARLSAVKADILSNLARSDLSLETIAARHRISPRYIGKLFEGDDQSFSEFVRNQRLERARRALADPRLRHVSVNAIAHDAGFKDVSYFIRSFKRRYAATPGDYRRKRAHE